MPDEMTNWQGVLGEYPTNPEFPDAPAALFTTEPYPLSIYRQNDDLNRGYPYMIYWPMVERREQIKPVPQRDIITVYDHKSERTALMTNGLAILSPVSAVVHEVMNGEWTLTLTHPCDKDGKWHYIRENNIIKCQGQYFTIKRVEWDFPTANTGTVTATCEHIFYQLSDMWVYARNWGFDSTNIQNSSYSQCDTAISKILDSAVTDDTPGAGQIRYSFEHASDWTFPTPWEVIIEGTGCTPVELLLGTNGIIGSMNGELFRDNFYFSINERMEGAQDNAFDIRVGENLCGVKRTVDSSEVCTLYRLYEGHGSGFIAYSYDGEHAFPLFQYPHNITRSDAYTFPDEIFNYAVEHGRSLMQPLAQICSARWRKYALPVICYDVTVKDVRQNPDFEGFENMYRFKVGDEGRIYDERFGGAVTLRITETETDGITGEVTRVVFGSTSSFTRGAAYPNSVTNVQPTVEQSIAYMLDRNKCIIIDANSKAIAVEVVL